MFSNRKLGGIKRWNSPWLRELRAYSSNNLGTKYLQPRADCIEATREKFSGWGMKGSGSRVPPDWRAREEGGGVGALHWEMLLASASNKRGDSDIAGGWATSRQRKWHEKRHGRQGEKSLVYLHSSPKNSERKCCKGRSESDHRGPQILD